MYLFPAAALEVVPEVTAKYRGRPGQVTSRSPSNTRSQYGLKSA